MYLYYLDVNIQQKSNERKTKIFIEIAFSIKFGLFVRTMSSWALPLVGGEASGVTQQVNSMSSKGILLKYPVTK